jgi:hypothetical protein
MMGGVVGHEETIEAKRERAQSNRDFLALGDSSQRERLERGFGLHGVEAMLLGSKADMLLWTDDLVQAYMAAIEFGTKRVWAQVVIAHLTDAGLLTSKERDIAAAKLVYMSSLFTSYDAAAMLEAVELPNGRPSDLRAVKDALYCMGRGASSATLRFISILLYVVATNLEGGAFLIPSYVACILAFVAYVGLRRESQRLSESQIA